QHVEVAEGVDGLAHHRLQIVQAGDVGLDPDGVPASVRDVLDQLGGLVRVGDVVDDDVGARAGGGADDGFADATVAPGDDHRLALERHGTSLTRRANGAGRRGGRACSTFRWLCTDTV